MSKKICLILTEYDLWKTSKAEAIRNEIAHLASINSNNIDIRNADSISQIKKWIVGLVKNHDMYETYIVVDNTATIVKTNDDPIIKRLQRDKRLFTLSNISYFYKQISK